MKPTFLSLSRRIGTNIALLCLCVAVSAQVYLDASAPMEQRVEDALARMTLQENLDCAYPRTVQVLLPRCGTPRHTRAMVHRRTSRHPPRGVVG